MQTPQNIAARTQDGVLDITWSEGDRVAIPFRRIRQSCPCAACVDEFTGRQILDPESVPESIVPLDISLAGNYALKIRWSDSHDSGLFTWTHLYELGRTLTSTAKS